MGYFIKILEAFLLKTLFNKDEYKFTSKTFNPIKLFTVLLLMANLIFTLVFVTKVHWFYTNIKTLCPQAVETLERQKKLEAEMKKK